MVETAAPYSHSELIVALERDVANVSATILSLTPEQCFAHPPGVWSAAENVLHMQQLSKVFILAFSMPRFTLGTLFGKPKQQARDYATIASSYQTAIAGGFEAPAYSIPTKPQGPFNQQRQQALVEQWQKINQRMIESLFHWDDAALDQYQIPHPALGKLTVREMLFFMHCHTQQHLNQITELHQSQSSSQLAAH
ncbi:DinB family protein [Herpetosiphon sp. NSE202]|uniref:DinB family protein n=1 Tax=Herpetosiphon sp. NSE202 TaxID=3351349 RepID=UPI00363438D7